MLVLSHHLESIINLRGMYIYTVHVPNIIYVELGIVRLYPEGNGYSFLRYMYAKRALQTD